MSSESHPTDKMTTADNPFVTYMTGMAELHNETVRMMAGSGNPKMQGVANLAAHPMGAMAAASAIGMGMASQMVGMMAGTMAGAMKATEMLASEKTGGLSSPFGLANPLNFDLATGSFEDAPDAPDAEAAASVSVAKPKSEAKTKSETKSETEAETAPKAKTKPELVIEAAPPIAAEPVAIVKTVEKVEKVEASETVAAAAPAEPVMPEDFVKPKGMAKPDQPDDLKAISGVGPKLEQVLNGLGVWTYAQIAGWKPEEVAWVDDTLGFKGRIERDEWIAQAAELVGKGKA